MSHRTRNAGGDGYVLISVLSVVALLAGLVGALLLVTRNAADTAVLASRALIDDAMTQSAMTLAGYELFVLGFPPERVSGQQIRLDQGTITLSVTSEAGKVDLNGSGAELLTAAYRAARLTAMTPETFAARVIDWRDADEQAGKNGAEADAYGAAGLAFGPRNGPFRSVDDLRWVLGVGAADVVALRDLVTVFNAPGRLSAFSAPAALIAALPGVAPEIAAEVVRIRSNRSTATATIIADRLLVQSSLIDTAPPRTYRVEVAIHRNTSTVERRMVAIVAAGSTPAHAFHVLDRSDMTSARRSTGG